MFVNFSKYFQHNIQNWTIEDCKNVDWSDESRFMLQHSDGRVRIWRKEHVFLAHFGSLSTNWASFKRHTWVLLLCLSLYDYIVPIFWFYFQQDNAPCHKAQIVSNHWFLEHDNEFTLLKWPPQSPDLSPIEHLWDVVEWEIRIMDVQTTNLQKLRDAIMTIWTKISEECFQHLVESMPRRIKAVLKTKGGLTRY